MKRKLLVLFCFVILGTFSSANADCPTPDEYRAKLNGFQAQMLKMLNSENFDNLDSATDAQEKYMNSIFPGCISYFQNPNTSYDCRKLQTLATSYIMLDKSEKMSGKSKIDKLPPQVQQKCSIEFQTLHFMVDD